MNLVDRWIRKFAADEDYAPGLPSKGSYRPFPSIVEPTLTDFVVQHHAAEKAGPHYDLRVQIPGTNVGASWAIPKAKLPLPGEKVLAVRQGDHRHDYFTFEGEIERGYGKGKVTRAHAGPVEISKAGPSKIRFVHNLDSKYPQEYVLLHTPAKSDKHWLLMNVTAKPSLPSRPRYKDVGRDRMDESVIMQAKLDGAHNYMELNDVGDRPRFYSYRKSTVSPTGIIEHTHRLDAGYRGSPVKANEASTLLRGEVWGRTSKNKPMRPELVGAMLNSSVLRSRQLQDEHGKLIFSPFDVVVYRGQDVTGKPYHERFELVKQIAKERGLEIPETAVTEEAKRKLLAKIEAGRHSQTREGVVLWKDAPMKLKLRPDYDGQVVGFFKAEEGSKYHNKAVGGMLVLHDGRVSRVGTGFTDKLRRDMFENPHKYRGMTVTVNAQEKLPSGKLRAASFSRFHIDKNEPEQLAKVATLMEDDPVAREQTMTLLKHFSKLAKEREMPHFTDQDRPESVKNIYRALKREHPEMPAEEKARIAARQGKPGKQHQGPPYKGPISKKASIAARVVELRNN